MFPGSSKAMRTDEYATLATDLEQIAAKRARVETCPTGETSCVAGY